MAARADPELVHRIVERGHERACHGDGHVQVFGHGCCEFEADVRRGPRGHRGVHRQTAGELPGADVRRERDVPWSPQVLVAQGFAYDSRPSDTFVIPERVAITPGPHTLASGRLCESPIASRHAGSRSACRPAVPHTGAPRRRRVWVIRHLIHAATRTSHDRTTDARRAETAHAGSECFRFCAAFDRTTPMATIRSRRLSSLAARPAISFAESMRESRSARLARCAESCRNAP